MISNNISTLSDIHTQIDGVCSSISSDVDEKKIIADSLTLALEQGTLAGDSDIDDSLLRGLFSNAVSRVTVHPFSHGIGKGAKFKTLSGPNALVSLGEKFQDSEIDQNFESAVVVVLTSDSYQSLMDKAESLGAFFGWPELVWLGVHIKGLLNQSEFSNTGLLSGTIANQNGLKEKSLFSSMPSFSDLAMGGSEMNPIDELNELLTEKKAFSDLCGDVFNDIQSSIPTDSIFTDFVTGSSIGKKISELNGVGHEQSHCCAFALAGANSDLTFWREVFSV